MQLCELILHCKPHFVPPSFSIVRRNFFFLLFSGHFGCAAASQCGDAYISSLLRSRQIQTAHRWVNIATVLPEWCFMGENYWTMVLWYYELWEGVVESTKWVEIYNNLTWLFKPLMVSANILLGSKKCWIKWASEIMGILSPCTPPFALPHFPPTDTHKTAPCWFPIPVSLSPSTVQHHFIWPHANALLLANQRQNNWSGRAHNSFYITSPLVAVYTSPVRTRAGLAL